MWLLSVHIGRAMETLHVSLVPVAYWDEIPKHDPFQRVSRSEHGWSPDPDVMAIFCWWDCWCSCDLQLCLFCTDFC